MTQKRAIKGFLCFADDGVNVTLPVKLPVNFTPGGFQMTEKLLPEVARDLGITNDKARYWLSLLDAAVHKTGRAVVLPSESANLLAKMVQFVADGFSPGEAAKRAKGEVSSVPVKLPVNSTTSQEVISHIEEMKSAIIAMAKEITGLKAEVAHFRQMRQQPDDFETWYAGFFRPIPKTLATCRDRYYHIPLMLTAPENIVSVFVEER